MNCKHCKREYGDLVRGLCRPCHRTPGVKEQYPRMNKKRPYVRSEDEHADDTEAKLDAMVAERYATMPDKGRPDDGDGERTQLPDIPQTVMRGRGVQCTPRKGLH